MERETQTDTNKEGTQEQLNKQPIYCVPDDAYARMMTRLQNGERYVKTYLGVCPHVEESGEENCKCPFNINFLHPESGQIVRSNSGVIKPVLPFSFVKENFVISRLGTHGCYIHHARRGELTGTLSWVEP